MVMKYNFKAFTKTVLTKSSNSITIVHENFQIIKVLKNPLDPQTRKKSLPKELLARKKKTRYKTYIRRNISCSTVLCLSTGAS